MLKCTVILHRLRIEGIVTVDDLNVSKSGGLCDLQSTPQHILLLLSAASRKLDRSVKRFSLLTLLS